MVLPQTSTYIHFVWVSWFFQVSVLGEKNPFTTLPEQFFLPLWSHLVHNKFMLWQAVLSIVISLSSIVKKKKKKKLVRHHFEFGSCFDFSNSCCWGHRSCSLVSMIPSSLSCGDKGVTGRKICNRNSQSFSKQIISLFLANIIMFLLCFGDGYWTKNCQIFLDPCIFAHRWYLKYGSTP